MGEAVFQGEALTVRIRIDAEQASRNVAQLNKQLDAVMLAVEHEARDEALRELDYATSTWTNQPVFKGTVWHRGTVASVKVSTTDKVFIYVDQGTRPHIITPKGEGYPLRFRWDGPGSYKPKSKPGILRAYRGEVPSTEVRRMFVHHPGTEARKFMEKVQDKVGKWAAKRIRELVRAVVAKH